MHTTSRSRRLAFLVLLTIALAGMTASAALAYSITGSHSLSSSSVKVGGSVTSTGKLSFDTRVYGIPIPSTAYAQHAFRYSLFNKPTAVSTTWSPLPSWAYKSADEVTGQSVWYASTSKTIISTGSINQSAKASAKAKGSGYIRYGTGKGHGIDHNMSKYVSVS